MNWIDKLERKYGRFGIPNLTLYIVIAYVAGFLLQEFAPQLMGYLTLDVPRIFHGQVWRLVTWVLFPPSYSNVLFFALAIVFFYYPLGTMLERTWGSFRYTLYVLCGFVLTLLGAFLLYFILGPVAVYIPWRIFTTYYITLSIILAYSLSFPEAQVMLWFVIPIKMKWMAYIYLAIMAYDIYQDITRGYWFMAIPIICSLINFALFYFSMKNLSRFSPKQVKRRHEFQRAMKPQSMVHPESAAPRHKCAICGRTEKDDPNLEFRFCSRCNGNYEYCQDHLFTHQHKV